MVDVSAPSRSRRHPRGPSPLSSRFLVLLILCLIPASGDLQGQIFERATVLENTRIHLGGGRMIENGTIVIRGGLISAIGRTGEVDAPLLSRTIDLGGADTTAGMIDLESTLALDQGGKRSSQMNAWDGFDRYASDLIREALSSGVTAVVLVPVGGAGITGSASLVRLSGGRTGALGELIDIEVAICIDLSRQSGPIGRLRSFETVRKSFRSASDHRDLLEDYQEELEEYVGELEKRDSGADDGKEDGDTLDSKSVADESADDDEEKTEELKKPDRPRRRPELQVLLRALDNEIPVRVTAHRSEEILNALALAEEFNLQLILVGATEAHLLIDEIKEQGATVLIAPAVADLVPGADVHRREHPGLAGLLSDHDIPWVMGSGARDPRSSRLLWMEARRLVSGSPGEDPFALVTRIPARHLGMGRRFGRLARGLAADLVIWSSDPEIDPTARAKRVLVDGKTVYRLRAPARREGSL